MDEQTAPPLDLQLLELLVPEDADRTYLAHQLCDALGLDIAATFTACFEVFARRRAMASEQWPQIAEAIAILEIFVVGIAYGYQLTLARLDAAGTIGRRDEPPARL